MSTRRPALPAPGLPADERKDRVIPALPVAAAINAEGNLDLAVAPGGMAVPGARAG